MATEGFKLTSKSTLTEVNAQVLADFGKQIDNDTAAAIRDAHRRGTIVWTDKHLTTTDENRLNIHR